MTDVAIRVEGVGKRYRIGAAAERHDRVAYALTAALKAPFQNLTRLRGLSRFSGSQSEDDTVWALKEVSFEVKPGEVLGIIGRNGAGKSTLLKILSRITEPTAGTIQVNGRIGALLEVGTGFHQELTGRENVYLNGSILGMARRDIDRRFEEIVEFSGVGRFIDTPVKRYSSGMYLRLAFSVAAHLQPEILVVDEVLAVGDAEFQKKCLGKMEEVAGQGRTVLFVSHNMAAVESLCTRCLVLRSGTVAFDDSPSASIREYVSDGGAVAGSDLRHLNTRRGAGTIRFTTMEIMDAHGVVTTSARSGEDLRMRFSFAFAGHREGPVRGRIGIAVRTALDQPLWVCSTEMTHDGAFWLEPAKTVTCEIPELPLTGGRYNLVLYVEADGTTEDWVEGATLMVDDADYFGHGKNCPSGWEGKCVLVNHNWSQSPS